MNSYLLGPAKYTHAHPQCFVFLKGRQAGAVRFWSTGLEPGEPPAGDVTPRF